MKAILSLQILILTWLLATGNSLISQEAMQPSPNWEKGVPLIENFSQQDYWGSKKIAQPQNWSITQDRNGLVYFANQGTILQFDGREWRSLSDSVKTTRSISSDPKGKIFVGGVNDFGYFAADSAGKMVYSSLSTNLDSALQKFDKVWKIIVLENRVYFLTSNFLFEWDYLQVKEYMPVTKFHNAFNVRGSLYITDRGVGLKKIKDGLLTLVAGGEVFAGQRIYAVLPLDNTSELIVTREQGLFISNKKSITSFGSSSTQNYLIQNKVAGGCQLADGNFAFSTLNGGIVIMNPQGNIQQLITKSHGLKENNVKFIFPDQEQGLWAALNTGISRIEIPGPISVIDERLGLEGIPQSIIRHQEKLVVATTVGIFTCMASKVNEKPWQRIAPEIGTTWHLISDDDLLIAATSGGIYKIRGKHPERLHPVPSFRLLQSSIDSKRIYAGTSGGFISFYRNGQSWEKEDFHIPGAYPARTIIEDSQGNIWFGVPNLGPYKIKLAGNDSTADIVKPEVIPLREKHKLSGSEFNIFKSNGVIRLATSTMLYRIIDEDPERLQPDSSFGKKFIEGKDNIFRLETDPANNIWIHANNETMFAELQNNGRFSIHDKEFMRIPEAQINALLPERNGLIWLGGRDGIFRYDIKNQKDITRAPPTLIRGISVFGDSLFYSGNSSFEVTPPQLLLPEAQSMLRFEYTLPSFDNAQANQYRVFLEGFDNEWSDWSNESYKEYSQLPNGDFNFRVQAKNIYQTIAKDNNFDFTVTPIWYKRWWVITAALIALSALMSLVGARYSREKAHRFYVQKELETAKSFQQILLPQEPLDIPGYDIFGKCHIAYDVGGDHYDFFWLDEDQKTDLIVCVVDVEGKRMDGAMYSVLINGMINMAFHSDPGQTLPIIYKNINNSLLNFKYGHSISLLLGKLDVKTSEFVYCNAGCPSPLLKNEDELHPVQTTNDRYRPALGKIYGMEYPQNKCVIKKGEVLFLFSDGLTEIKPPVGEKSTNPIQQILKNLRTNLPANELSSSIFQEVSKYQSIEPNQDDKTLIVIKRD